MAITAQQVKGLREKTGVGMMECKKALQETEGDEDRALKLLRERGIAQAGKRAGFKKNDVMISFDGQRSLKNVNEFYAYAMNETTNRLPRRVSTAPVRKSACFQRMPVSSSCMQIAFSMTNGAPSILLSTPSK